MSEDTKTIKVIPSAGIVQRSNTEITAKDETYKIAGDGKAANLKINGQDIPNNRVFLLEAVVSDSPDGLGHLVTFRHPIENERIVGVVIAPRDDRPEVDGVWVADEDGKKDP